MQGILSFIRRILFLFAEIILMIALILLFIFPQTVADSISRIEELNLLLRIGIVAIPVLILLYFASHQIRPGRRPNKDMLVVNSSGSVTHISKDSVKDRLLEEIRKIDNVASATATVEAKRNRADLELEVGISGQQIKIPEKQREIEKVVRQVIREQLGLQLADKPTVRLFIQQPRALPAPGTTSAKEDNGATDTASPATIETATETDSQETTTAAPLETAADESAPANEDMPSDDTVTDTEPDTIAKPAEKSPSRRRLLGEILGIEDDSDEEEETKEGNESLAFSDLIGEQAPSQPIAETEAKVETKIDEVVSETTEVTEATLSEVESTAETALDDVAESAEAVAENMNETESVDTEPDIASSDADTDEEKAT